VKHKVDIGELKMNIGEVTIDIEEKKTSGEIYK